MIRLHRIIRLVGLLAALVSLGHSAGALAAPPPEQLLPITTREFFASPSVKQMRASFSQTQFGKLFNDSLVEKFTQNLSDQAQKGDGFNFLGFTLDDLSQMCGGEAAWATVEAGRGQQGEILLLNIVGKNKRLEEVLGDRINRLKDTGATERSEQRSEVRLIIQEKPAQGNNKAEFRVHCVKDDLLIAANSISLIEGVLQRWAGATGNSLADLPAFKSIEARTRPQASEKVQVRFFVDPFGLHDLTRTASKGPKKKDRMNDVKKAGLDGFKGIGGFFSFDSHNYDFFYRVAAFAPKPHRKGMGIFQFAESEDFTPPDWVCAPLAAYTTLCIDLRKSFDSLAPLYDQVLVDGEEGTFEETLADLKKDRKIRLDVREEIIGQLCNHVVLISDSTLPVTKKSNRFLTAIPVKNHKIVDDALFRFYNGDDRVKKRTFQERFTIWETVPPRKTPEADGKETQSIPYHAVAVSQNYVYLASNLDLLEAVLRREREKDAPLWLGKQEDYLEFSREAARLGGSKAAAQQFINLTNDLRVVYEMTRRNDLKEVDSMYTQLLQRLVEDGKLKLRGELLPEYSKVSHHLGTGGNFTRTTPDGWEIIGFYPRKAR